MAGAPRGRSVAFGASGSFQVAEEGGLSMRSVVAMVVLVVVQASASGQVYVVAEDGSGDFTDLQVALDSVPPGSVLDLRGEFVDHGYPITVTKSVTLTARV